MRIKLLSTQLPLSLGFSLSLVMVALLAFLLEPKASHAATVAIRENQPSYQNTLRQDAGANLKQTYGRGEVPGRRNGGGRRDDCPAVQVPLTALVAQQEDPSHDPPLTMVGGVTTAERPTFWFYVPYALNAELTAEFILKDATGASVYQILSVDFPDSEVVPGLIRISLPNTVAPLEIGQVYEWYFKVNCGAEVPIYTNGGIERITIDAALSQQLAAASPQQQARLYQEQGLWYDAVATLGELLRSHPSDTAIAQQWSQLLQTLGLADILPDTSSN